MTLLGVRHLARRLARRSAVGLAVGVWPGSRRPAVGPPVGGWPASRRPAVGPPVGGWPASRRLARQSAIGPAVLRSQPRQCCGAEVTIMTGRGLTLVGIAGRPTWSIISLHYRSSSYLLGLSASDITSSL